MLPRTARAGLLARRQFHHSCLQLAKSKSNNASKTALRVVTAPSKTGTTTGTTRPKEKAEPTAEQVARDALAYFFLSAKSPLKGKATQARHYGTLALNNHAYLSAQDGEKKNSAPDEKRAEPETPEAKEQKENEAKQSDRKDESTDKAKEEPKDDKDVRREYKLFLYLLIFSSRRRPSHHWAIMEA